MGKSIIRENLKYANKYYLDEKNRKAWVDKFHNEAVKKWYNTWYR